VTQLASSHRLRICPVDMPSVLTVCVLLPLSPSEGSDYAVLVEVCSVAHCHGDIELAPFVLVTDGARPSQAAMQEQERSMAALGIIDRTRRGTSGFSHNELRDDPFELRYLPTRAVCRMARWMHCQRLGARIMPGVGLKHCKISHMKPMLLCLA
jgi:hypothetical protein